MTVGSSVVTLSLYPYLPRAFPLLLATLLIIVGPLNAPLSDRDKKHVCNRLIFPGNTQPLSFISEGRIVPLFCGFRRRDNLLAWRELTTRTFSNTPSCARVCDWNEGCTTPSMFKYVLIFENHTPWHEYERCPIFHSQRCLVSSSTGFMQIIGESLFTIFASLA